MTDCRFHESPILLVHAYLDDELDPANALEIVGRMASDPRLAAGRERVEALQRLIQERLPREPVPPGLRARIEAVVRVRRPHAQPSWLALAASIAVTAMIASGSTWVAVGPQSAITVADAVVAGHVRALMAAQPTDVISSDQDTVKPWFNSRIPEAPRVVNLAEAEFPLVGGRLDVVAKTPVPTLVYRHRQHLISLTVVPAAGRVELPSVPHTINGYNLVRWSDDRVVYWVVSDLNSDDLARFAELFRTTTQDQ